MKSVGDNAVGVIAELAPKTAPAPGRATKPPSDGLMTTRRVRTGGDRRYALGPGVGLGSR